MISSLLHLSCGHCHLLLCIVLCLLFCLLFSIVVVLLYDLVYWMYNSDEVWTRVFDVLGGEDRAYM